jgi:uncharacterized protein (DUF1330 family)
VTVYGVGLLTIHDRERYARYAAGFMDVLERYGGRLLAADSQPTLIEGEWERERVVLLEFDDADAFERWWSSPEYREISGDRIASTTATVLLVSGSRRS